MPSFFDLRIFNTVLNRRCMCCLWLKGGRRRYHIELSAMPGLTVVRFRIDRPTKRKLNLLDVLIGPSRYGLNRWPEVIDHVVVGDNVRNILSLTDDLNITLGWLDVLRVARFVPMRIADKSVSSRSNVIIRVGPRRDRLTYGDVRFGRKRSPATCSSLSLQETQAGAH